MTQAPSPKEALEIIANFPVTDPKNMDAVNMRAVAKSALSTLQPSGERREAIARKLAEKWPGDYMQGDDECEREPNALAYETADAAILASGLVQDEAGWRDISTAPKDGGYIVANRKRQVAFCDMQCGSRIIHNVTGFVEWDWDQAATHWMPLPAPPIRSARDGGGS